MKEAELAVWSEEHTDWYQRVNACLELLIPELAPRLVQGATVLDLGCGIGRLTIPLARAFPGCRFVGYDISRTMLGFARERDPDGAVTWQLGGPLPECDAVLSVVTIQHLEPSVVRGYFTQLGSRLRHSGVLCFQYVEGDHHAPDNHQYSTRWMSAALGVGGLVPTHWRHGLLYDEWTWVTAERYSGCACQDPWSRHPSGFTWDRPGGPPFEHTPRRER
jgi:cyclopropane fatty-acyl-phospholipid synthase-like methyltransferase